MRNTAILLALGLCSMNISFANNDRPEHELHAMMVYNFIKYIQWPTSSDEFTIAVVKDDQVFGTLNEWYGGKIRGGKKITVVNVLDVNSLKPCDILYLGASSNEMFNKVKSKLKGDPTLLVTNKAGLGQQGSSINFKTVGNKLKFELNQKAIESASLKVSSQLTAMAILI